MDTPSQQNLNQLAIGTVLGDFKITGIVGEGGFGIVYLAYEAALDRTVAIKEYLPSSIAGRTGNQSVMVRSQLNTNAFTTGLKNFLREAQLLARFSHPAMVEVHRVWEQNSTAYMAMRYYDGKTLRELRQADGKFDELYIRRLVEPICDALTLLHAQNVIHRDVSPDNILMRGNGAPVLLDLGAARLVVGGMTQALTTILKPGYAPIEQYVDDGTMRQGPWTDVYGLGAVLYYLLTGAAPPQAVARMITDPLRDTLASKAKIPVAPYFVDALAKALAVRPDDRYQSVDELRDGLQWHEPLPMEPRTAYARAGASKIANAALATVATIADTAVPSVASQPSSQSAPVKATAPVSEVSQPLDRVFAQSSDATVVWQPASDADHPVTGSKVTPAAATAPPSRPPVPPPPPPADAPVPMPVPRAKAYGEAAGAGNKLWIYATLAALLAAGAGYFALNRGDKAATPPPPVVVTDPASAVTPPVVAPPIAVTASPALVVAPPLAKAAAPAPTKAALDPAAVAAKTAAEAKAREATRNEQESLAAAKAEKADKAEKAKRDAEDKAKAKADVLEKSARAKSDAEERAKARAKQDADERAAAASRAETEERARKARAEEEERQAAAKARADAEKAAKAASPAPALVVTPARRTVEELSAAGKAAFGRGEITAARAAWNELVNHPDAQARSKAVAYNNLAVSYCQSSDEASCERMYLAMFRADRNYDADERDNPTFKKAYDRAARTAKALR